MSDSELFIYKNGINEKLTLGKNVLKWFWKKPCWALGK